MEEYHNTPTRGHEEVAKTYNRLRANVTWDNINNDVADFIG